MSGRKVVLDASVIISMEKGEVLTFLTKLKCDYFTTKNIESELENSDNLSDIGVETVSFVKEDYEELEKLILILQKKLSFPDISVLYLAKKQNAILLTGDKCLKKAAKANGIEVHGVFWILDNLVKMLIISGEEAKMALTKIEANSFLPEEECDNFRRKWEKN